MYLNMSMFAECVILRFFRSHHSRFISRLILELHVTYRNLPMFVECNEHAFSYLYYLFQTPSNVQVNTSERLADLRNHYVSNGIQGYLVPSEDAHQVRVHSGDITMIFCWKKQYTCMCFKIGFKFEICKPSLWPLIFIRFYVLHWFQNLEQCTLVVDMLSTLSLVSLQSAYPSNYDLRREFISGFSGSAGKPRLIQ